MGKRVGIALGPEEREAWEANSSFRAFHDERKVEVRSKVCDGVQRFFGVHALTGAPRPSARRSFGP